jgi:hypothetical protein
MGRELEAVLGRDLPLQHLERLEMELHDLAAACADEVVVMFALEGGFVAVALAHREERGLEEASLHEQRYDAIDRGHRCLANVLPVELTHEIVHIEVAGLGERGPQDRLADRGHSQRMTLENRAKLLEGSLNRMFLDTTAGASSGHLSKNAPGDAERQGRMGIGQERPAATTWQLNYIN